MVTFRKLNMNEVEQMFNLIKERIEWMNQKGIKQWNVTDYLNAYPIGYYQNKCIDNEIYGLFDYEELICAGILLEEDDRWNDKQNAYYLHNFVSKVGRKGAGILFLQYAEEYAKTAGKEYIRLDSAVDNTSLTRFYESIGFMPKGTCSEGSYKGVLREKKL